MKIYENMFVLRNTDAADVYQVHQRLDYHIQETRGVKLAYSWFHQTHPQRPDATIILMRSGIPLEMAGEKSLEVHLTEGMRLKFKTVANRKVVDRSESTPERRITRYLPCSKDLMLRLFPGLMERAGFSDVEVVHVGQESRHINVRTKGRRPFSLLGHHLEVVATVADVAAAEQAIAQGVGSNRIFGFGMLRELAFDVPSKSEVASHVCA